MRIIETEYTSYEFTEGEELVACVFSELQSKHIANEISIVAIEKSKLAVNIANPYFFQLEHEHLRGRLEALQYLLATSENKKGELRQHLEEQAASDQYNMNNHIDQQG